MTDKIKSNLTTAYMLFVFEFGEPSGEFIPEMFDYQKSAQKVRINLGKEGFKHATATYFNHFQTSDGIEYLKLDDLLSDDRRKKVLIRYLGRDKVMYLSLIITILKSLDGPKKGLLAA